MNIKCCTEKEFQMYRKKILPIHGDFLSALEYLYKDKTIEDLEAWINSFKTRKDFVAGFALDATTKCLNLSSTGLDIRHSELLKDKSKNYTLISNHRDICMDAIVINIASIKEQKRFINSAIGSNLFQVDWIAACLKLVGGIIVKRGLTPKKALHASKELSEHIKECLEQGDDHLWIAQREGRTKDGNDKTNNAIIKMLLMAKDSNTFLEEIKKRNILPFSISYEMEPCQDFKLKEIYVKTTTGNFEKSPNEDIDNIIQGIIKPKGKIVVTYGEPINKILDTLNEKELVNKNKLASVVTNLIDQSIYKSYYLHPSNYIAYDIMNGNSKYSINYSKEEKQRFEQETKKITSSYENQKLAKSIFLGIYASPVKNKLNFM